jgi:hypothetical protein
MKNQRIDLGYDFQRMWISANALGLGVGMALFAAIAEGMEQSGILGSPELGDKVGHLVGLALAGALFGLMQWSVLRRYISQTGWSTLGSAVGLTVGYIGGYIMGGPPFDFILAPALAGLLGGIAQWFALRHVAGVGWWAPASALGFLIGGIAGTAIAILGLGDALGGSYLAWIALNGVVYLVAGAIGGAITASVLIRLLRRSAAAPASESLASGT